MLTENDVIGAVADYLRKSGYSIQQQLNTSQKGIDVEAKHPQKGLYLVEAKGATSSKPTSNRYGIEFNSNQIKTHIGVALLKSFQTLQATPDATVAIALPNNHRHRNVISSMETPIRNSGIKILLVNSNGSIEEGI